MKENKLTKIHCFYSIVCSELYMASHVHINSMILSLFIYKNR